jgi:hypothetical protein
LPEEGSLLQWMAETTVKAARRRKGFLALAAFAVFSVLAQPVCAALELRLPAFHSAPAAQSGLADTEPGESTPCCAESEDPVLTPLSTAGKSKGAQAAPGTAVPARAAAPPAILAPHALRLPASLSPPAQLSYYARSARILR